MVFETVHIALHSAQFEEDAYDMLVEQIWDMSLAY